jgi:hypothetical protein
MPPIAAVAVWGSGVYWMKILLLLQTWLVEPESTIQAFGKVVAI